MGKKWKFWRRKMQNDGEMLTLIFGETGRATRAVDHVFAVLAAAYGSAWDRSLGKAPLSDTKTVWASKLDAYLGSDASKRRILWALKNLPVSDTPPNAMQFSALCAAAPEQVMPALPEPKADPARLAAELEKLAPLRQSIAAPSVGVDFRAWARRILANPAMATQTSLQMARNALSREAV
jgi:hypothetical protein